jgi:hypothetical protein
MRHFLCILFSITTLLPLHAWDVDYRLSGRIGWIMPDGKVDKIVQQEGNWTGPVFGADFSATFHPDWASLRAWNGAGVGVGLSYWHLSHQLLGQAFAPYAYLDIPIVKCPHFVLGIRPAVGAAFMTKTYQNTVPEGHLYVDVINANECVGSVTNLYFPEMVYMEFPIAKGWSVGVAGGWYHISNGSVRQPNSGYNIFAGELAVRYSPTLIPITHSQTPITKDQTQINKHWSIAIAGTASGRQVYYRDQQTFFVSSLHAAAYWHAHTIFHVGGGVDVFYDGAYIQRATDFRKTNLDLAQPGDCWRVGVSIQPEFVVGNFTAGLHIGAYMHDPVKALEPQWKADGLPQQRLDKPIFYAYNLLNAGSAGYPDGWLYTSVALRYHLPLHMFVQAMMKSHLTKVEFVSLGLGFYY